MRIFIVLFLVALFGGFIFFKDGFTKSQKVTTASAQVPQQVLYDRINYLDYSQQNLVISQKYGRTLLFFAATSWCSNCVELEKQINAHTSELPKDITVLKVDYDNDKESRTKYAVTQQTTLVLLDTKGQEIKRWIGTGEFTDLMQNIN